MRNFIILLLFFCFLAPISANAKSAIPTKKEDILVLMEKTGVADKVSNQSQILEKTIKLIMEKKLSNLDENNFEKINKIIKENVEGSKTELTDMLIPIYDNNFSHDEIREINIFLSSNAGKKLLKNNDVISKNLTDITNTWTEQTTLGTLTKINSFLVQSHKKK
jgi:hypothetical protein